MSSKLRYMLTGDGDPTGLMGFQELLLFTDFTDDEAIKIAGMVRDQVIVIHSSDSHIPEFNVICKEVLDA